MKMYKKKLLFSMLLCTLTQHASDTWLEIKPSYFFFNVSPMKNIYKKGGFQVQSSVSVPVCNYMDFYGSIGYRQVSGYALNSCEKTKLVVIPIDIGLKPICNFSERFFCFFAIGPRFFCFNQDNNSSYIPCAINSGGIGFFTNTGLNILLKDRFLLGIFGEYSYEKKAVCSNTANVYSNGKVQIGGVAVGLSLGYSF